MNLNLRERLRFFSIVRRCLALLHLAVAERSPEKAGVGGSIPSLATIFSSTWQCPFRRFGSNSLHQAQAQAQAN